MIESSRLFPIHANLRILALYDVGEHIATSKSCLLPRGWTSLLRLKLLEFLLQLNLQDTQTIHPSFLTAYQQHSIDLRVGFKEQLVENFRQIHWTRYNNCSSQHLENHTPKLSAPLSSDKATALICAEFNQSYPSQRDPTSAWPVGYQIRGYTFYPLCH